MPEKSLKSAASKSASSKSKIINKFPVSQVDYTQPLIIKNSKVSFGEKLEQVKDEHKDRLEDLIIEMESLRRENVRLRRQQEDTFGISMDTVQRMKKELERAKTTRMFLLEDIENRKAKSEKMEADIFELNMKLESFTKQINEYQQMRQEWIDISEKLLKTEDKCDKLLKVNKNLRMLLLKHHIDPISVEFDSGRSKQSSKSDKGPTKPILKPNGDKHKLNAHTLSHMHVNSGKRISQSVGDKSEILSGVSEDIKRHNMLSSRRALGRGPPSYLGYYTDIHHHHKMMEKEHETLHLPRLVAA